MPATVTTPANTVINTLYPPPTTYVTATTRVPKAVSVSAFNAVAKRMPVGDPIWRWNGTAWVQLYRPRF